MGGDGNAEEAEDRVFEIDPVEDLDAAIAWYVDAVEAPPYAPYGAPRQEAAVDASLRAIDEAIAPLVLPPEVRWFWQTWDARSFERMAHGALVEPGFALESWHMNVDDGFAPRALFPVGYMSHQHLLVDLTDPRGTPASLWTYEFDDCERVAPSLAALVRGCAERVEAAGLDRPVTGGVPEPLPYFELFHGPAFDAVIDRHFATARRARMAAPQDEPDRWPSAWRDAERAAMGEPAPGGATHTVAAFVAELGRGRPRATLRGRLTSCARRGGCPR
jgi:hypothetical protein